MKNLLIFIIINITVQQNGPYLPSKYKQNFTEKQTLFGLFPFTTTGTIYYNHRKQLSRVDRANGRADKYCIFSNLLRSSPCSHYVHKGNRYLHFPKQKTCCLCCTKKQGCGMLKIDFLVDAKKIREFTIDNQEMIEWQKEGMTDNKFIVKKSNDLLYQINMKNRDVMNFDKESFDIFFNDDVFDLPKECEQSQQCNIFSLCRHIPKQLFIS